MINSKQCLVSQISRSSLTFEEYRNVLLLIQSVEQHYISDKTTNTGHDFRIVEWKYDTETDMIEFDYQEAYAEEGSDDVSWKNHTMTLERKMVNNPDCFDAYVKYHNALDWYERNKNTHKNSSKILECKQKQLDALKSANKDDCLKKPINGLNSEIYSLKRGYESHKELLEKNLAIIHKGFRMSDVRWSRHYQDLMKYCSPIKNN